MTSPSERPGGRRAAPLAAAAIARAAARAGGRPIRPQTVGGRRLPAGSVVAVAMSGGVDSAVAAALVVAAGLPAFGVTMRLWGEVPTDGGGCCSVDAVEDARRAATRLGMAHYVLDLSGPFADTVVRDFVDTAGSGRTPNPCVRCNQWIKFSALLERVRAVGATHLATGHYARVRAGADGRCTLHRALDVRKDQSYTLYHCGPGTLAAVCLPLGEVEKVLVRRIAAGLGLGVAAKPDSQELCFVGGDHRAWLRQRLGSRARPGPIVSVDGTVVGGHTGLAGYTVGQRSGLGLSAVGPSQRPLYVLRLDPQHNRLVVGPREALCVRQAVVEGCVYLDGRPPAGPIRAEVQLRAHGGAVAATWEPGSDGCARVRFEEPEPLVAPGQSAVCYRGDRVVAGGTLAA
ncbi:MAG TPA: tRNA 2-thiouridine(34) synthase MnmA [Candidatus Micrarchaeia archaeon]|nr:tRNA 2-thiouridine(34) synthase MnmA [Candidatus Micrarchaeia archaeon]